MFGFDIKTGNSSIFASKQIEIMKKKLLGEKGHIAIKTNDMDVAIRSFSDMGFELDGDTLKIDSDGNKIAIYFRDEIAGFAIHLVKGELKMAKDIVIVCGSPRNNGNTEILVDAFIKGVRKSSNQITKIKLSQLKINGCTDCKHCFTHDGECIQRDGMDSIYPMLRKADMIVFASPIYYYGFSSQIKAVIDRLYAGTEKKFPITSCALIAVYADTDTILCEPLIAHYKAFTNFLEWEDMGIITVEGMEAKGDINDHKSIMQTEQFGESIK